MFSIQMHHNPTLTINQLFTPLFITQDNHLKIMVTELNQEKSKVLKIYKSLNNKSNKNKTEKIYQYCWELS